MTQENKFQIQEELPTDLKQVNPFLDRVFGALEAHIQAKEQLFKIKLSLEEALTNAMRHGNGLKASRKVKVSIIVEDGQVRLDVLDEGSGFNPMTVPDPTQSGYAENMPTGRGIYLMRQMMDSVEFYDGGRGVRMTKKYR